MIYPIARFILAPLIRIWIKKVEGLENLPRTPCIITANHSSFADDLVLPIELMIRLDTKVHMYCNDRFYKSRVLAFFLDWAGCIPVSVNQPDRRLRKKVNDAAFRKALEFLKKDEIIGIFPEGGRSLDGRLREAKTGAVKLALRARVPIVPIGIIGTHDILPKGKKIPRLKRCTIRIGKPMDLERYHGKQESARILARQTRELMKRIAGLIGQEYRY